MNIEIANRLVQLRKKNNLSQEDLASKIGISRQAISKWERAEASPDTDNLISLSKIYKVSLDDLLKTDEYEYEYIIDEDRLNGSDRMQEEIYSEHRTIESKIQTQERGNGYRAVEETKGIPPTYISKKKLLTFPYPVFVTVVYLILGSVFNWWHPAWILYLTIPLYYPLVATADIKEDGRFNITKKTLLAFPYPVLVTIVYLLSGFAFNLWHPGWVLYLTVPVYYSLVAGIESEKDIKK